MKKTIYQFNNLLRTYFRYQRKLKNLKTANRNQRRQHILQNHIARLYEKLMVLKASIKLTTATAGLTLGLLAFTPNAQGQSFAPKVINPFSLVNINDNSAPTFADLDGDGDFDMLAGNSDYYYNYYTSTGEFQFQYFENIGTAANPVFTAPVANPFGIANGASSYYGNLTPTFVDLDGDGDMDIVHGSSDGKLYYLENIGSSTAPVFAAAQTSLFGLININNKSAPTFADLDGDGDFDMLVGNDDYYYNYTTYTGEYRFYYFENTGNATNPDFSGAPVANPFGIANGASNYGNLTPTFVDLDGDGDMDILHGNNDGSFYYLQNIGTPLLPNFTTAQTNPFNLTFVGIYSYIGRSKPTFADLDNDGDLDLMAGDNDGDFNFYKQCQPSTSNISPTSTCSYTSPSGLLFTASGVFTDIIPNSDGCDSTITINLTINPLSDQTVSSTVPFVCNTGTTTIDLGSSQNGVNYFLRNDANDTIVDGPIAGNGSGITFNTDTISSPTTYNVYGVGTAPSTGLQFDGNDDYVDAGTGINLANSSFSIEFWAKKSVLSTGNDDHIIGLGDNTTQNNALHIGFRGSNQFTFAFFGNDLDAPSNLADTNWHHWAVTYNKALLERTIYRDGIIVVNGLSSSDFTGTGNFKIGRAYNANSNNFTGSVDEVRVWNSVRTQTEIMNNMNQCLTGSETGLLAYYKFEDGIGSTALADATSSGNNGTLTNMNPSSDWGVGSTVCSTCNLVMTQTITINVEQPTTGVISPTACNSYVSPSGNFTFTASGTFSDTIPNVAGCDSVITINLTIIPSATGTDTRTACNSLTWIDGNTYTTSNNTATFNIINGAANGCDSLVSLDLTINTVDVTIDNSLMPTLSSNQAGATYRWLDCDNGNAVIPSETAQTFTATANGNYAVEVTVGSCVDTSACENITGVGIKEATNNVVSIYPNPTNGMVNINLASNNSVVDYTITSIEGKVIATGKTTSNNITIDLSAESKGVYFIKINNESTSRVYKLIKQ